MGWSAERSINRLLPEKQTISKIDVLSPTATQHPPTSMPDILCQPRVPRPGLDILDPLLSRLMGRFALWCQLRLFVGGLRETIAVKKISPFTSPGGTFNRLCCIDRNPILTFKQDAYWGHRPEELLNTWFKSECCQSWIIAAQLCALVCLADRNSHLICHLIRHPWASEVTQIWDPGTLMYLSYQKHFLSWGCPSQNFLSPIIPHDLWKKKPAYIYLSRCVSVNHASFESCTIPPVRSSILSLQPEANPAERCTRCTKRCTKQDCPHVVPLRGASECVYTVKMKLFI